MSTLCDVPILRFGELFKIDSGWGLYSPGPGLYKSSFSSGFFPGLTPIDFDGPSFPITFFCEYYPGPGLESISFSKESCLVLVPNL